MDRNLILAIVLSMGVLVIWEILVAGPEKERMRAAQEAAQTAQEEADSDLRELSGLTGEDNVLDLDAALAAAPGRIAIRTPALEGSINLQGGRIDDLKLIKYKETLADDSDTIRLLRPREAPHGHYIQQGWITGQDAGENAVWQAENGAALTPETPVTLTRQAGDLIFEKKISVDDQYMFTVEQTVRNTSGEATAVKPYAIVVQRDTPEDYKQWLILHEGPLGVIGQTLYERKYNKLKKNKNKRIDETGEGGWVGITNKYWLAAVVPPQDEVMDATLSNIGDEELPIFRATYGLTDRSIPAGGEITLTSHVYGGPKDVDILQSYEHAPEKGGLGIYDFDKAVDWGNFFFLTRPIFYTLNFFGDLIGNFGVAILILTLIIKAILFPLANKGYESMTKMKKLQPQVEELRTRYADDRMKMQQEMMELYKKEKMNPLAGCFPILLQMPIFYALYKTLFVTLELRHQPFLYINDLSAQDPTTIFNLFGLLPYDPTALPMIGAFLGIGILPLLMGVAMWFQMRLSPPPADPVQAQVFGLMPFLFVFIFAPFAAGLVLYWFWNTALSILQQMIIMKKNGVSIDIADRLPFIGSKSKAAAPGE